MLCFFFFCLFFLFSFFAVNTTACLVARQLEGSLRFVFCFFFLSVFIFFFFFSNAAFIPWLGLINVSSCAGRGGLTWKRPGHISDTGMAGGPCASCSVGSTHQNAQTSNRSRPSRSGMASPLLVDTQIHTDMQWLAEVKREKAATPFPPSHPHPRPSCPAATL